MAPVSAARGQEAEFPGGAQFLEGRHLQRAGKWSASIERFRAATEVYSLVSDYALYQMAQSGFGTGNTELAARSLEELLSLYPETPIRRKAQLELANLYYETGKPGRAAPLIQAALPGARSSRETVDLMLLLAKAYAKSGNHAKSDSICWRLIHGWPSTREALEAAELVREIDTPLRRLAVAKAYYENKKANKALELLETLMGDPDAGDLMPELLMYKALSLAKQGKKQAAAGLYDRIIADYPSSPSAAGALFERAEYRRASGLFDEALADFERLVQSFPRAELAPRAIFQRARTFERLGDPRAYEEYKRVLEKYPQSALAVTATMRRGVKRYREGDYPAARDVFEELRAANLSADSNANASLWIAKCESADGKPESAKVELARVIGRFKETYQAFRARSMLRALDSGASFYSDNPEWAHSLTFERDPFVSLEVETAEDAFASVERELASWDSKSLRRLEFLLLNHLPEAEWELRAVSRKASGTGARYALAWALFHVRAYHDALRLAYPLSDKFPDERSTRVSYLLYPPAYPDVVRETASHYRIDPALTWAIMREESHFLEDAISGSDARGLMQILPSTGEYVAGLMSGPASFEVSVLFAPSANIEMGAYYLRYLLDKFDNDLVLTIAAYNWGETSLRRWLSDSAPSDFDVFVESIPADETRRYLKKVLRSYAVYKSLYPPDWLSNGE